MPTPAARLPAGAAPMKPADPSASAGLSPVFNVGDDRPEDAAMTAWQPPGEGQDVLVPRLGQVAAEPGAARRMGRSALEAARSAGRFARSHPLVSVAAFGLLGGGAPMLAPALIPYLAARGAQRVAAIPARPAIRGAKNLWLSFQGAWSSRQARLRQASLLLPWPGGHMSAPSAGPAPAA